MTLRWNFQVGDRYVYKNVIEFSGDGQLRSKVEVTAEIEVLIDHGKGEYRLGSIVREVNAFWKDGEWRSGKPTELPEKGVPLAVEVMTRLPGKYCAIAVTDWGYLMGSRNCDNREDALREPDLRRLGTSGFSVLPFDQLILPRTPVTVGDTWRDQTGAIPMGNQIVTITREGRLLAVGEMTSDLECKMTTVAKRTEERGGDWDSELPGAATRARVKWRHPTGLLEHCMLEETVANDSDKKGRGKEVKRVEVTLLTVNPGKHLK
jgi:hypothetical protein